MIAILKKLTPQSESHAFWLSLFLCLFICCMILFVIAPITGLSKNFGAGNDGYIQLARSLAAGDGYVFEKGGPPVFHRPPMYPLFLVPVALFPENLQRYVIVIPQSILVGFIGMMIFKIARRLYNQNVAVIALLLFLINPWVYWNAKNPMTPIFQTFLYLIFCYFAALEIFKVFGLVKQTKKTVFWLQGLIIGVFGEALALTHAAMLPVVLLYIITLFIAAIIKDREKILTAVVTGLVVVCLIAPWTYRNWVTFGRFIPISGGGGLAYFNGNVHWNFIEQQPQKHGESYIDASLRAIGIKGTEANDIQWKGFKDIKSEEFANEKMVQHIKSHPVLFFKKIILNAIEYYFPAFIKPFFAIKSVTTEELGISIFHLFLWVLAITSCFCNLRKGLLLLAGIALYSIWYFPFATFIVHSLYTLGTIPFLSILAAVGILYFSKMTIHLFYKVGEKMIKLLQKMLPQHSSQAFWLSFFLCLSFCGIILFVVSPLTGLSRNFGAGNDGYIQLARSLAVGNGYVFEKGGPLVFHRPPLYPLFLVPVALFPENLQRYLIVIPQSILVGFIGMMLFKIACRLYNQTVAKVAILLFLINPWVYWYAKTPMTPVLQTFLYLIFAYFAAQELFGKTELKPLKIGLIIGATGAGLALTHSAMLPMTLLVIGILFVAALIRNKGRILTVVVAGLVVICFISSWTYRNYVVFDRFIPVAGNAGLAYFNGNVHWNFIEQQPQRLGESYTDASLRVIGINGTEKTYLHWQGFKDIKDEELADKKMFEQIRNNPVLFIKKVVVNAVDYYFPVFVSPFLAVKSTDIEDMEEWAITLFYFFLWFPVIWGIFHCWQKGLLLLSGIVIYSVWYFPFGSFIGHHLYTFGTIPFLCILSASGIVYFFKKGGNNTVLN